MNASKACSTQSTFLVDSNARCTRTSSLRSPNLEGSVGENNLSSTALPGISQHLQLNPDKCSLMCFSVLAERSSWEMYAAH